MALRGQLEFSARKIVWLAEYARIRNVEQSGSNDNYYLLGTKVELGKELSLMASHSIQQNYEGSLAREFEAALVFDDASGL